MKRKRKDRERQGEEKAETEKKEKRECRKKYQPGPDPLWGYCSFHNQFTLLDYHDKLLQVELRFVHTTHTCMCYLIEVFGNGT